MAFLFRRTFVLAVDLEALKRQITENIREHKGWYIFQGILFVICGVLAAVLPGATALGMGILIGALLLVSGAIQLFMTFKSKIHWWSVLSALLSLIAGGIMIFEPFAGLIALVTVVAIFLTIEGVFEIMLALKFRPVSNWWWMLLAGIVTLILAALLWVGFPELGILYLGWMIAINLLLYGISLLMLVWKVGK
jgi:uncharacterized membrane protein HdeD (DUF308 family)